jgi:DNA-binding MurR/RpiR family transcriptional regulator
MAENYLTTEEFAERARTSPSTVRYWRMCHKLDFGVKRGKRVLYPESKVERWLAGDDDQGAKATA